MIGGTWNITGTGKTGRKQALADWISKNKLEVLVVQETKKASSLLNSFGIFLVHGILTGLNFLLISLLAVC
jgi:exonuclease III